VIRTASAARVMGDGPLGLEDRTSVGRRTRGIAGAPQPGKRAASPITEVGCDAVFLGAARGVEQV
jgi:hypothetical protein